MRTYANKIEDQLGRQVRPVVLRKVFGAPELRYEKNSRAYWSRPTASPLNQKGGTGWLACLHGRVQTGDDWAALYVPVEELPVPEFNTAQWAYYMTSTQTMGVNIVIWVHDPTDFDKRAEITQLGGHADLEKAAGWNAHEFSVDTAGMFYYGENVPGGTQLVAGTQYTWEQFQADTVFSTWTIYRISIEFGWEASGTFDHSWVAELMLNGENIPLMPRSEEDLAPIHDIADTASALAMTIAPKTPYALISARLKASAALAGTAFTITLDAEADGVTNSAFYDAVIFSSDLPTSGATSLHQIFDELPAFDELDELDVAQSNTGSKNIGCDICWKPV